VSATAPAEVLLATAARVRRSEHRDEPHDLVQHQV